MNNATTTCATFRGSFSPATLTGGDKSVLYLGSNNNLYFPAADRTMNACRAYFELNLDAPDEVKAFVLDFNEDKADGIGSIQNSSQSSGAGGTKFKVQSEGEECYDLSGRKMPNGKLPKGIYIQNGRKILF